MFRLTNAEVKPLTMQLAKEFHAMEASPTERELNPARVKHLREKAESGKLVTFHWSRAKVGNRTLRMNGQHSSHMLCDLNGAFPDGLKVHLDDYEVEGMEGLADLFRQFDDRKSGRTAGDVSGAYQMLFEPLHEVPRPIAKIGVEGIAWYRRHVAGLPAPSGDDQYTLFAETGTHEFLRWLGEVFSIKTPELRRVPVVSAMYSTFNANASEARMFWSQVARGGAEYEDNAPSTVLDAWLKAAKEEKKELKPGNFYQGCIYAWNAHRESKPLKGIKYDAGKGLLTTIE